MMAAPLRRTLHLRADPPLPSCKISAENCCRLFPTKYAASLKRFMIYGGVYALAGSVYFRDALIQKSGSKYINVQNQTPRTRTSTRQRRGAGISCSVCSSVLSSTQPPINKTWMVLIIWTSDPSELC